MNRHSGDWVNCCQKGVGSTGETYHYCEEVVRKNRPKLVLIENVGQLKVALPGEVSDAAFIEDNHREMDYWAKWMDVEAADYGSLPMRERIIMHGIDGLEDGARHAEKLQRELMAAMRVPSLPAHRHIYFEESSVQLMDGELGVSTKQSEPKKARETAKYLDFHCELFRFAQFPWPLKVEALDPQRYSFGPPGWIVQRAAELVVFCDRVFAPEHTCEFLDANKDLKDITEYKLGSSQAECDAMLQKTVWRDRPFTITSLSRVVVRFSDDSGQVTLVRALLGWETMRLIGWSPAWWDTCKPWMPTHELMVGLAGNAFSGFAIGPALAVGLALCGVASTASATEEPGSDSSESD